MQYYISCMLLWQRWFYICIMSYSCVYLPTESTSIGRINEHIAKQSSIYIYTYDIWFMPSKLRMCKHVQHSQCSPQVNKQIHRYTHTSMHFFSVQHIYTPHSYVMALHSDLLMPGYMEPCGFHICWRWVSIELCLHLHQQHPPVLAAHPRQKLPTSPTSASEAEVQEPEEEVSWPKAVLWTRAVHL